MPLIGTTIDPNDHDQYLWRANSCAVNEVLAKLLDGNNNTALPYNLGLYARKWSVFAVDTKQEGDLFKCPSSRDNIFNQERPSQETAPTLDLLKKADNLLQIEEIFRQQGSKQKSALERVHQQHAKALSSLQRQGWKVFRVDLKLRSPLVHGLGETHPLEKFLTFDRNTGMPYLPSSTVKGVLKARCMIWKINQYDEVVVQQVAETNADGKESKLVKGDLVNEHFPLFQELFGSGDGNGKEEYAAQGKLVFFDAFPVQVPQLRREIMTPHYPKYYQAEEGPTESQSPVPNAYLAVDPQGGKQEFRFCFAAPPELSQEHLEAFLQVFSAEEVLDFGFGAKTAIGMGQFAGVDVLRQEQERLEQERLAQEEAERKAKEEAERKAKEEAERIAQEAAKQKEQERREALGWSGRYLEDIDLNKGDEILKYLLDNEQLLPEGEESEASPEKLREEKQALGSEILRQWQQQWSRPTHYQQEWLNRLKAFLGVAGEAPKVKWPKNKEMSAWLEQESNWRDLPLEQLKELKKRAEKALKPKDKEKLEAIKNLLQERES